MLLEICAATVDDVQAAKDGGADRIELNMGLEVGGLTPSPSLVRAAREIFTGEILVMIRPRSGDFCYSEAEKRILLEDAESLLGDGASGIVFGGLSSQGQVDRALCREMRKISQGRPCVFHRALDLVQDWRSSLEQLKDLGIDRVLTSGMQATAGQGQDLLRQFVTVADPMAVVAGSGINPSNLESLAKATGCRQFHGTFSRPCPSPGRDVMELGQQRRTDVTLVREARAILDSLS